MTDKCRKCGIELDKENWFVSQRRIRNYLCKKCSREHGMQWRHANPEKAKAISTRNHRKQGHLPFNENKECSQFLGIHVAERVLRHAFKNIQRMPMNHKSYDLICNKDKKIDVKSSCIRKDGQWLFNIKRNTTVDYFLCLAFDSREALNLLHAWLIHGSVVNHLMSASIGKGTLHKWDAYQLDVSEISTCCATMRTAEAVSA